MMCLERVMKRTRNLENKGRVNHFHARGCAMVAWFTGGEVKNDAHSELECVELQAL